MIVIDGKNKICFTVISFNNNHIIPSLIILLQFWFLFITKHSIFISIYNIHNYSCMIYDRTKINWFIGKHLYFVEFKV